MVRYKGRHYAKQYMPAKPVKRGLKVWMRCDPNGYCHDLRPYMGKHDIFRGRDLGERVVMHLCRALRWKSHHVFFDRFFTSVKLVRTLEQKGIYSCGTIKKDATGFPDELKAPNLRRGETQQLQHDNLVATVWKDKKLVHLMSTTSDPVGDDPVVRRLRGGAMAEFVRPPPVTAYHKYMGGVDRHMQHRAKYPVGIPSKKYWKYFVNFMLEVSVINAFLIYKNTPGVQLPSARYSLLDFRMDLAQQLIGGFSSRKRARVVSRLGVPAIGNITAHQSVRMDRKTNHM
ncbi:piggyBac transposable element-derived protein 2-like [Argopecten irradians]|uniref:piggyBac transposable element-derived protein 2-like n=1 Tax=Argopecten irradians TaxID=31199 RepID=UPI003718099D